MSVVYNKNVREPTQKSWVLRCICQDKNYLNLTCTILKCTKRRFWISVEYY